MADRLTQERRFPIQGGPSIPWDAIAPHEAQAQRNHDQTLERLAQRMGLSPCEAVAVLEDRKWRSMDHEEAKRRMLELVSPFEESAKKLAQAEAADPLREGTRQMVSELRKLAGRVDGYLSSPAPVQRGTLEKFCAEACAIAIRAASSEPSAAPRTGAVKMTMKDLVGPHVLTGCDMSSVEDANAIVFVLDGIAYRAQEDPSDGYRSYMGELSVVTEPVKNTFDPVPVRCELSADEEVLRVLDVANNAPIIEVGTNNADDYYPLFIGQFHPELMAVNQPAGSR